jgi:hypothetical protein
MRPHPVQLHPRQAEPEVLEHGAGDLGDASFEGVRHPERDHPVDVAALVVPHHPVEVGAAREPLLDRILSGAVGQHPGRAPPPAQRG